MHSNRVCRVQLVPLVVWNRRPEVHRSEAIRVVLGSADEPAPFQTLLCHQSGSSAYYSSRWARTSSWFLDKNVQGPTRKTRAWLRLLLRRFVSESHVIRGPRIRSHSWTKAFGNGFSMSKRSSKSRCRKTKEWRAVRASMSAMLDSIMAVFLFVWLCLWELRRFIWVGFIPVSMFEKRIERIRASKKGTPILFHLIALIWIIFYFRAFATSAVCDATYRTVTLLATGYNISKIWSILFEEVFKGGCLSRLSAYRRLLIRDEFPIEFFIEEVVLVMETSSTKSWCSGYGCGSFSIRSSE